MTKTLCLVRHAEPVIRKNKKLGLTDNGRQQATETARKLLAMVNSDKSVSIHHAPVLRCAETAAIIVKQIHAPIIEAPLRLHGADALTIDGAQSKMQQYIAHYKELGIESPDAFSDRILKYIQQQPSSTIILVGNEVPLRLLATHLLPSCPEIHIGHGQFIKLEGV